MIVITIIEGPQTGNIPEKNIMMKNIMTKITMMRIIPEKIRECGSRSQGGKLQGKHVRRERQDKQPEACQPERQAADLHEEAGRPDILQALPIQKGATAVHRPGQRVPGELLPGLPEGRQVPESPKAIIHRQGIIVQKGAEKGENLLPIIRWLPLQE